MTGRPRTPTPDDRATARLLFAAELADGTVTEPELLATPEVWAAVRDRVPSPPRRLAQALERRAGRLDTVARHTVPAVAARRAVLGDRAEGAPKVLLRVDEYPHWLAGREPERWGDAAFARWAELVAGVPHLVAVVPRPAADPERARGSSRPLDDAEVARLHRLAAEGASFGLHGLEHRTRHRDPRRHTELGGRGAREVALLLDRARTELAARAGIETDVLVPPFNTFDARQWPVLAARFRVITGGPESVLRVGAAAPATVRGGAAYLPAYPPLYGSAAEILPALERHVEARTGLWTPVVLHWGWEAHAGWRDLERLLATVAELAVPWTDFTDAVGKSV